MKFGLHFGSRAVLSATPTLEDSCPEGGGARLRTLWYELTTSSSQPRSRAHILIPRRQEVLRSGYEASRSNR